MDIQEELGLQSLIFEEALAGYEEEDAAGCSDEDMCHPLFIPNVVYFFSYI